jgi:cytochrome c biogenesis protein CcmG/thiol:disulfide interchange protein DsbE
MFYLPLVVFLVLVLLLFVLLQRNLQLSNQTVPARLDRPLPEFTIPGLKDEDIRGAALLHVTASWCAVCKIEHRTIMQLSKKIPVYGIAWKDQPEALNAWLKREGSPYMKLGFDEGALGVELGLTGTPESFLISKNRRIIAHYKGPISETQIAEILEQLR